MPLPPRLEKELAELRVEFQIEVTEESDIVNIVFKGFAIGDGFNRVTSDLLLRLPKTYPDAGPDMFWTVPELLLLNGAVPQNADSLEDYIGHRWRRFSWHKAAWNPTIDNLH